MSVPIPNNDKTKNDPSYRYMRDKLDIKKEGEFYVIKNIEKVSKQIYSNIDDIVKYLNKAIGQKLQVDKKLNIIKYKSNNNSVNVENFLEEYIKTNVICKKCSIPEFINNSCAACGFNKS